MSSQLLCGMQWQHQALQCFTVALLWSRADREEHEAASLPALLQHKHSPNIIPAFISTFSVPNASSLTSIPPHGDSGTLGSALVWECINRL